MKEKVRERRGERGRESKERRRTEEGDREKEKRVNNADAVCAVLVGWSLSQCWPLEPRLDRAGIREGGNEGRRWKRQKDRMTPL